MRFATTDTYVGTPAVLLDLSALPARACPYVLPAYVCAQAVLDGGFTWELRLSPTVDLAAQTAHALMLFEATVDGTAYGLWYQTSGAGDGYWQLLVAGVAVLQVEANESGLSPYNQSASAGDDFRILISYRPAESRTFVQFVVNGVATPAVSTTIAGSVPDLAACTALTLGSKRDGTLPVAATLGSFRVHGASAAVLAPSPEILLLGDSITACLGVGTNAVAGTPTFVYTAAEAAAFAAPRIVNIACPGATFAVETANFSASAFAANGRIVLVDFMLGVNDGNAGHTSAQMVADAQTLVTTVRAALPRAKVVAGPVTPCRTGIGDVPWAQVAAFNAALLSGAVTDVDLIIPALAYYDVLDDGTGALAAPYDTGDHIHPNKAGRQVIGAAKRAAYAALGVL